MNKDYLVTKSNYFIMNSSYDLRLEEQKIILTLASMVQPNDEEFKPYKFRIADFMELLGVEDKSKYIEIPKITKELMKKVFEIQEGNKIIQTAWLSGVVYEKGTGYVELTFSPYLKPYMLKLSSMFTQYKLANILSMKSKYSPRMYELLKCNEFKKQGYIEIEVKELRKLLKAEDIYPLYADFKRYIIYRSQKELKKISDINFDFQEIKTGRKVTSIKFYIHTNKPIINKNKAKNEIAATTITTLSEDQLNIKFVKNIIKEPISDIEASKIFNAAECNLEKIKEKYNIISKFKKVNNVVGAMIKALEENWITASKTKVSAFNNYKQRTYNFEELEKQLTSWEGNYD